MTFDVGALSIEAQLKHALGERDLFRSECETLRSELEQLRDEIKLRDDALDATTSHFLIADARRRGTPIVYVNRAIAADHGYEPQELLGKSPVFLNPPELNAASLQAINDALRRGTPVRAEMISRRKDGSTFWTGITLTPVRDEAGEIIHYLGMGTDITQRLAAEERTRQLQARLDAEREECARIGNELQLAQKLESVGRLASGIAHEINTPIQYVGDSVLFLQSAQTDLDRLLIAYRAAFNRIAANESPALVLQSVREAESAVDAEFLDAEIPRAFERTLEGVRRVAGIVVAMKEFAHPEGTQQSAADLNRALQTTLVVARNEYKYHAQVETDLGELPAVVCHIGEINQVILNLIVNAAHAIAESGQDCATGRIRITTQATLGQVSVRIADNGCGIPEQNLRKVFDPFFTTKEVGRGTGQGLAIARSIVVDKHGGNIDVQSELGVGTSFVLRLPIDGYAARVAA